MTHESHLGTEAFGEAGPGRMCCVSASARAGGLPLPTGVPGWGRACPRVGAGAPLFTRNSFKLCGSPPCPAGNGSWNVPFGASVATKGSRFGQLPNSLVSSSHVGRCRVADGRFYLSEPDQSPGRPRGGRVCEGHDGACAGDVPGPQTGRHWGCHFGRFYCMFWGLGASCWRDCLGRWPVSQP